MVSHSLRYNLFLQRNEGEFQDFSLQEDHNKSRSWKINWFPDINKLNAYFLWLTLFILRILCMLCAARGSHFVLYIIIFCVWGCCRSKNENLDFQILIQYAVTHKLACAANHNFLLQLKKNLRSNCIISQEPKLLTLTISPKPTTNNLRLKTIIVIKFFSFIIILEKISLILRGLRFGVSI